METFTKQAEPPNDEPPNDEPPNEMSVRSVEFPAVQRVEPTAPKQSWIREILRNIKGRRIVGEPLTLWTIVIALLILLALEFEIGGIAVVNLIPQW